MEKRKLKLNVKIIISIVVFFITLVILSISYFFYSLTPINNNKEVKFQIGAGTSSVEIIDNLKKEELIRNKYVTLVYLKMNNYSLKAGTYALDSKMSTKEIFDLISSNESEEAKGKTITFVEGKPITYFADRVSANFNYEPTEIYEVINNREFLNELIDKYWFLDKDILKEGIFYPLEGYLFPDTYTFKKDSSIKEIVIKVLDNTERKLNNLKDGIDNSNYSVHELITLASIIELEGGNSDDRSGIAGVFYNRIKNGWTLGSDVTTYYAVQKGFDKELTKKELAACNAYNTRGLCVPKLPIGAIANPSIDSISATVYPKEHNYFYFAADKNGVTYFTVDQNSHDKKVNELKEKGLWYNFQN